MKRYSILLALVALVLVSLACQAFAGGDNSASSDSSSQSSGGEADSQAPDEPQPAPDSSDTKDEYPMPDGAYEVRTVGNNINFFVKMSVEDALKFYRDELSKLGYAEVKSSSHLNIGLSFGATFENADNGKSVTVQGFYINPDGTDSTDTITITIIPVGD